MIRSGETVIENSCCDPAGLQRHYLDDDLGEGTPLAAETPELADQLLREQDAWRQEVGADMMQPHPDGDPDIELPKRGKQKATRGAQE